MREGKKQPSSQYSTDIIAARCLCCAGIWLGPDLLMNGFWSDIITSLIRRNFLVGFLESITDFVVYEGCVHICNFKDRFAFFTGVLVIQLFSMSCVLEPCFHYGEGKLC